MRKLICAVLLAAAVVQLGQGCANKDKGCDPVEFPQVQIPSYIADRQQAVNYLVRHYWNGFFKLEACGQIVESTINGVDSLSFDQAVGNFAGLLAMADAKSAGMSVEQLFENLDSLALHGNRRPLMAVMDRAEYYLYNPNSPLLNEEVYLNFLNGILSLESLSQTDKMQYEYQHKICSLNRVGTPAADFEFRQLAGMPHKYAEKTLYKDVKGEYTLLFFNNPDCSSCADILAAIKGSILGAMAQQGDLSVLAMYIDEDLEAWHRNREKFPEEWVYAHDHNLVLRDNNIYGLRAIPSLYLLDKEKKVLLKDATVDKVIEYFL